MTWVHPIPGYNSQELVILREDMGSFRVIRVRNWLPFVKTWVHPIPGYKSQELVTLHEDMGSSRVLVWSVVLILLPFCIVLCFCFCFVFICFVFVLFCFVCLLHVSFLPNVSSVSGLSIRDFCFLLHS